MKNAVFVADVSHKFTGSAKLYRTEDGHVVVSSVRNGFANGFANETMVFRSDEDGNVIYWSNLGVAYPSGEFAKALADAGYVVEGEKGAE